MNSPIKKLLQYLISMTAIGIVGIQVITLYYEKSHIENIDPKFLGPVNGYLWFVAIAYVVYKALSVNLFRDKLRFSPLAIFGLGLLNLAALCVTFFECSSILAGSTEASSGAGHLFFSIIGYMFLPFLIVLVNYGLGKRILSRIASFSTETPTFRFLMSVGLGFSVYITLLAFGAMCGIYNSFTFLVIIIAFGAYSYKEIYSALISLHTFRIEFDNHKPGGRLFEMLNPNLVSAELAFIVLTFLISVNFIFIVRPMPIGWDDLGVYMNFARLMGNSGTLVAGAGMWGWPIFTGVGYIFKSAPQAFFLNEVGGIMSVIVLSLVFNEFLENGKKRLLALPIIFATMFYSMPMVIFQQAKDMKLDPGLFFITVIGLYGLYHIFSRYLGSEEGGASAGNLLPQHQNASNPVLSPAGTLKKTKTSAKMQLEIRSTIEEPASPANAITSIRPFYDFYASVHKSASGEAGIFERRDVLTYLFVVGIIVGLAFTIKFTSLMLILGMLGVIVYSKMGFSGFLGYFFLFISVFTGGGLWDKLNVSYPKNDKHSLLIFAIVCLMLSFALFVYSFMKYKKDSMIQAGLLLGIFLVGVFSPIVPWFAKNIYDSGGKVTVDNLLNGKFLGYSPDLTKIHSSQQLKAIEEKFNKQTIDSQGNALNEDLGRYFGYDGGINNYLKLPINLTLQSNQGGEFTDITYFYLALVPIVLVFLNFKDPRLIFGPLLVTLGEYLYYFRPETATAITGFFAGIILPFGYVYIAGFFLVSLGFFLYALKSDRQSQIFKLNLVFLTIYGLLFVVAAYGIVWYGIAMYFSFLLMAGVALTNALCMEGEDDEVIEGAKLLGTILVAALISTYFVKSTFPHGINNLQSAGYQEFKKGNQTQEIGIFASHPDYFLMLATLNIKDQKSVTEDALSRFPEGDAKAIVKANLKDSKDLISMEQILRQLAYFDLSILKLSAPQEMAVRNDSKNVLDSIYKKVLDPSKENRNSEPIYRIGTFLTYFISDNRNRYYDDSLVTNFDKYFYAPDPEETISRMKKLGMKYLLVDLNAATIDRDPRHDLTRRFENLLNTMRSNQLELIHTDSICLRIALEEKGNDYNLIAGVNFESYQQGQPIDRRAKMQYCYDHIAKLISENKITGGKYPYLQPLNETVKQGNMRLDSIEYAKLLQQYVNHGWSVLFRIK